MTLRIPLLSDIVFKYIFGSERSTEILKTFINPVLGDYGYPVLKAAKERYGYFVADKKARSG